MSVIGRASDQYVVRFPTGLRDQIKVLAAQNRRSMNSEIVTMLERAVKQEDLEK